MPTLENFSENSLKAINLAKDEARRLGHNFIGSEQLLIGLLGVAGTTQLLNATGVSLDAIQVEVEKIIGRGSGFVAVEIPFTPNARRAIETASATVYGQGRFVEPEHLLLGIVDLENGVALKLFKNLGLSIPKLREAILAQIQTPLQQPTPQQVWESETQSSLLPAIPPFREDVPKSIYATTLPQENGRWVAEVRASRLLDGPNFRSIGYGDNEFQAIAEALESLARMYRNYKILKSDKLII